MKLFLIIAIALVINPAQAQIYKCEIINGKIQYQETECAKKSLQNKLQVQAFDSSLTEIAQERLSMEVQYQKEVMAAEAEQALIDRSIRAIEAEISSNEALAEAAHKQAIAIDQNTKALKNRRHRKRGYYYNPVAQHPRIRPSLLGLKSRYSENKVKSSIAIK